jgi:hypothetical protein
LLVEGVCDGQTWKRGETAGFLSCWVGGLADNCDRNNLHLRFGACRAEILYIGDPDVNGFRQVNARVPVEVAAGEQMLTAGFGGVVSPPVALRIMRA